MAKTVLITGASSGIGRATARVFLNDGWQVYATARDPDDVADLAADGAQTAELDVTHARKVERVVDRILDEQGRIDCLVNNAGYGQFGPVEDVPTDVLADQYDVNVYGPHRLTRAVLPQMREQGEGTIVNVSSIAARFAAPGMGAYVSSKAALDSLSGSLRAELGEYGVDVVLVEPGPVSTNFADRTDDSRANLERSGGYDHIYAMQDDRRSIEYDRTFGIPPGQVAYAILDAANTSDPPARRTVGTVAALAKYLEYVPDRWRDSLFGVLMRAVGWIGE
jgi:NAD(P)-dependent dehydrogenase (short-subunit alcohol dehydrogenase family)